MKSYPTEKLWSAKQVAFVTLIVVCIFLSFWLLYRFRAVVFLFFTAIVFGTTMRPAVEWLYRHGLSRSIGIIAIYILIAAILVGFLALFVPLIVDQTTLIFQNLPQYQLTFRETLLTSHNLILRNIGSRIPAKFIFFGNDKTTTREVLNQVNQTFNYVNLIAKGVLSVLAVFLLAYYWTQESNFVIRNLLRVVPPSHRKEARIFVQVMEAKIGGYVRGEGILTFVVGSAAFISYILIGLPYALVLAIVAGLTEVIPVFGPILGTIPAFLVALSVAPRKAVWVLVAIVIIQTTENAWLAPRVMNHSMGVHPIIILLSLITFGSVFGFPGALLALPLAAIIQLILERIVLSANGFGEQMQRVRVDVQSLLDQSQTTAQAIEEASQASDSSYQEIPEHIRKEITLISQEIQDLLERIKNEDET